MNIVRIRIRIVTGIFMILLIGLSAKLFWIQVVHGEEYTERANKQHHVTETIDAYRGEVLVHEKDEFIPLATTKQGWLFTIDPRNVSDPEAFYEVVYATGELAMEKGEFLAKARKTDDPYEVIQHRLSFSAKEYIEEHHPKGVHFEKETWRYYPASGLAAQVVGFVGTEGIGLYGLEGFYDGDLTGQDGFFSGEKSLTGGILSFGKNTYRNEQEGTTLILTIDAGVQAFLEKELETVYKTYNASRAGGIIIHPKTGRIYAMAGYPSYDPNIYFKQNNISAFQNPMVENVYEMGSVIKPITMAAGIDAGVVTPESTYYDPGTLTIDGSVIENYDGKGRGTVSMQEVLSQSLNTGVVHVMEKLGRHRFYSYFHAFGLGEKTGIDLPNEVGSNVQNLESNRDIEFATASYGQGIAVTGIQLARALSAIANGGTLIDPYIVEAAILPNGETVTRDVRAGEGRRVIKKESAETVTRMLTTVVDEALAGGDGNIPGYSVAAKTGTAQIAYTDRRGYSPDFMHTFFGYGPSYDPEFLVLMFVEKPQGVRYSSETLTDPFRNIMKQLFAYYEIFPDRPDELE